MPDILTISDIMRRYGCVRQTAGKIMKKLPFFVIGGRKFVKARDLQDYEESLIEYPAISVPRTVTVEMRIPRRKA